MKDTLQVKILFIFMETIKDARFTITQTDKANIIFPHQQSLVKYKNLHAPVVIIFGNGIGHQSSNPGQVCLHFISH